MLKQQRNSAWQLAARGAWEARLSILLQSLRRSFALIHTTLLIGRVQWKAAACNGKSHIVQWKVGLYNIPLSQSSQDRYLMIPYRTFMSSMRSTD
jgi:hypothetical protein